MREAVTGAQAFLERGGRPVVVIVRHPDAGTEWTVQPPGCVDVVSLDLGGSFDVTSLGPQDAPQLAQWCESALAALKSVPAGPAHDAIRDTVLSVWEQWSGKSYGPPDWAAVRCDISLFIDAMEKAMRRRPPQ